jgi:LEA14-like dessication related protein
MRKTFSICFIVLLAGIMGFGCQKQAGEVIAKIIQPPEVKVADFTVREISNKTLNLGLLLDITNPDPVGLNLDSVEYSVELADQPFFSGKEDQKTIIAANGVSRVALPVAINYSDLKAVFDSLKGLDEVPYKVTGTVKLDTPIGPIPLPIKAKGTLPIIRAPRIDSVSINVDSISLSSAKLKINLGMINPNSFPVEIKQADYSIMLKGKQFSSGQLTPQKIAGKAPAVISVPLTIDFASLGTWAYSMLLNNEVGYTLSYHAKLQVKDWPVVQKEQKTGTLQIWR